MDLFIIILFYLIATFLSLKVIGYGIFEWKQHNPLGGSLTIVLATISYIFFAIMLAIQ